jgi:hypothetical protein
VVSLDIFHGPYMSTKSLHKYKFTMLISLYININLPKKSKIVKKYIKEYNFIKNIPKYKRMINSCHPFFGNK